MFRQAEAHHSCQGFAHVPAKELSPLSPAVHVKDSADCIRTPAFISACFWPYRGSIAPAKAAAYVSRQSALVSRFRACIGKDTVPSCFFQHNAGCIKRARPNGLPPSPLPSPSPQRKPSQAQKLETLQTSLASQSWASTVSRQPKQPQP